MKPDLQAIQARADAAIERARVSEPPPFYVPGDPDAAPILAVPPFTLLDVADLAHTEPPPPRFLWAGRIPVGLVTLLAAHGGTGKSTLALMLALAVAAEQQFLGLPTMPGGAVYLSAEDGADLLRYRVKFLAQRMGIDPAEVAGRLHLLDATQGQPELFRDGKSTLTLAALRKHVAEFRPKLIVLDNASDVYADSEIDRSAVRRFMREAAALAIEADAAVLLLAHVDKGTSRGDRLRNDEAYSGSTAWHNSARSRLFMSRDRDGALKLEHQKCNVGPLASPLSLEWPHDGIPALDQPLSPVVQHLTDRNHTKSILRLIHEFEQRGEYVTTATTSRTHAGKLFASEATFPPMRDSELFDLLRRAERAGQIERVSYRNAHRNQAERWQVTAAGMAFSGIDALTAVTAATSLNPEVPALAAGAALTAATSPGVLGGNAAHESPRNPGRDDDAEF